MTATATSKDRALGQRCGVAPGERHLSAKEAAQLARDLQLLADPVRLQILDLLASLPGQVCVCDLEASLPIRQPTISHHLRLLLRAGLVTVQRRGLWAYYTIRRPAVDSCRSRIQSYLQNIAISGGASPRSRRTP